MNDFCCYEEGTVNLRLRWLQWWPDTAQDQIKMSAHQGGALGTDYISTTHLGEFSPTRENGGFTTWCLIWLAVYLRFSIEKFQLELYYTGIT